MDTLSATNEISPIAAILWCFYPISALVLVNLFLSFGQDDDDDDQDGGKGIRVARMQPVPVPSAS